MKNNKQNLKKQSFILNMSKLSLKDVLAYFKTTNQGYKTKQALKLLTKYGSNVIALENEEKWPTMLIKAFFDPFSIILLVIVCISFFTDVIIATDKSYFKIVILVIIITISGLIHFIQEMKSKRSLKKLKDMVSNTTAVLRDNKVIELPFENIVIGDIIILSAGDIIPADLRLLSSKDLYISQSSLTGESDPIEKDHDHLIDTTNLLELKNICLMGTNVISGTAQAIVIATGKNTYFGKMAKTMTSKNLNTAFDKGIKKITTFLIRITIVMSILVFLLNALIKGNILESFIYTVAVAVGIMPELLLVIVTSNLAKGSIEMAKKKTIIKELPSIQNFGAMDILCTDKTGTLTEDHIVLQRYLNVFGQEDITILESAFLNSHFQTGLKNVLDIAVIDKAKENKLEFLLTTHTKIDEIPYDFQRRRMSVVIGNHTAQKQIITKGAIEEILAVCKYVRINEDTKQLSPKLNKQVIELSNNLNKEGLRVIAIATKMEPDLTKELFTIKDEEDMVLIGFVAFLDPPKPSAKKAIASLYEHGVNVKVITGDNEIISKEICKEVAVATTHILFGQDIDEMTEAELMQVIDKVTLFVKTTPTQKAKIVDLLQKKGHVVGYLGDGINDAPALLQADVGISVDSGAEIAKEVADVVLLEKSLMVLEEGIIEGRKVFANINKYFKITISSNIGNIFSILCASIILPFLPMLPIHLLIQNLLYEISQLGIIFDYVDLEYVKYPKKWDTKEIVNFIWWFAPISTIFDLVTFALLWFVIKANSIATQALFHSGWFVLGLLSQTVIVHIIRTEKIPFFKSKPSPILLLTTFLISSIAFIIPFTTFGHYIQLVNLPLSYFISVIVIVIVYIWVTDLVRKKYIKYKNDMY